MPTRGTKRKKKHEINDGKCMVTAKDMQGNVYHIDLDIIGQSFNEKPENQQQKQALQGGHLLPAPFKVWLFNFDFTFISMDKLSKQCPLAFWCIVY